jgi:hypothetical protein
MQNLSVWLENEATNLGLDIEKLSNNQKYNLNKILFQMIENGFRIRSDNPDIRFGNKSGILKDSVLLSAGEVELQTIIESVEIIPIDNCTNGTCMYPCDPGSGRDQNGACTNGTCGGGPRDAISRSCTDGTCTHETPTGCTNGQSSCSNNGCVNSGTAACTNNGGSNFTCTDTDCHNISEGGCIDSGPCFDVYCGNTMGCEDKVNACLDQPCSNTPQGQGLKCIDSGNCSDISCRNEGLPSQQNSCVDGLCKDDVCCNRVCIDGNTGDCEDDVCGNGRECKDGTFSCKDSACMNSGSVAQESCTNQNCVDNSCVDFNLCSDGSAGADPTTCTDNNCQNAGCHYSIAATCIDTWCQVDSTEKTGCYIPNPSDQGCLASDDHCDCQSSKECIEK